MYTVIKPYKFELYVTEESNKMSASKVRAVTGASVVINATLYDSKKWVPLCDVKKDGKILSDDAYAYWGYGWNNSDKRMTMCNDISKFDNYISCVGLIKEGNDLTFYGLTDDVKRASGRTAIGFKDDGSMVVWCTKEGTQNMTPEELRVKMHNLGCVDALMLDGGGSSQLSQEGDNYVYSSRMVNNYLCIWEEKEDTQSTGNKNPYTEPTRTLKEGCVGDDVRWLQFELNKRLGLSLDLSAGIFYTLTKSAVKAFQKQCGLTADGVVGQKTLNKLKEGSNSMGVCNVSLPTFRNGDSGFGVAALQAAINQAGYSCGSVDGIFGSNTENAIKKMQSDMGAEKTGIVDENIYRKIFVNT